MFRKMVIAVITASAAILETTADAIAAAAYTADPIGCLAARNNVQRHRVRSSTVRLVCRCLLSVGVCRYQLARARVSSGSHDDRCGFRVQASWHEIVNGSVRGLAA